MSIHEAPELFWLVATTALTGVLWIPYIANRIRELGPPGWAMFPLPDPPPRTPWAVRTVQAHVNAVENLVIFAPLALSAHIVGANMLAAAACSVYFFARLAHAFVTISGMPIPFRTVTFLVGFASQTTLGFTILHAT